MRLTRWITLFVALTTAAFAAASDSLPDPRVDIQGGTGSVAFFGTLTVNFSMDQQGNLICSSSPQIVTFNGPGNFCQVGEVSDAFANDTGRDILAFHFEFDTEQGPFTAGEASLFPDVTPDGDGFGATYSGGDIVPCVPNAQTSCGFDFAQTFIHTLDDPTAPFSEFYLTFNGVNLGPNGTATVTVTAVPEPASMLLLGCGIAAIGVVRRKRVR
jgi:hypothetical protein